MIESPIARAVRPWLILILVCAVFSTHPRFRETFWTVTSLNNVLQQAVPNIILAVGMTFVILTGGIDLSVGPVVALCGVALGLTQKSGPPAFLSYIMVFPAAALTALLVNRWLARAGRGHRASTIGSGACALAVFGIGQHLVMRATAGGIQVEGAILAGLAVGLSCGLLNGIVITKGSVPPFIVTLGMYTAARPLAVYATGGVNVSGLPLRLMALGQSGAMVLTALAVVLAGVFVLNRTRPGRYIVAIGGNQEASRLSGVDVSAYKMFAYAVSGMTAAITATLLTAQYLSASTNAAVGFELNAIAAVVIGGTSLSGGQGSVIGSLVGALTIAVVNMGLVLVGVPSEFQGVVIGGVIVLAVMVDRWRAAQ